MLKKLIVVYLVFLGLCSCRTPQITCGAFSAPTPSTMKVVSTTYVEDAMYKIFGVIYDSNNYDTYPFVKILVKTLDNTTVAATLSDIEGNFDLSFMPGKYTIEIFTPGCTTYNDTIDVGPGVHQKVEVVLGSDGIQEL